MSELDAYKTIRIHPIGCKCLRCCPGRYEMPTMPTDRDTAPQQPNPPSRYKGRCDMHGLRVCDECQYGETDAKLLDAAEKRIAALEAQLAEAQTCPTCYGTGEVLPAGPSDAPVEFCDACVVGLRKENEWWKERLAMAVEALFAYGDRNEMTADPWWAIVAKNRMGSNAILAGPFFSRERAEEHRQARLYEYGKGSIVFCFSGHRSQHYKDLRAALTATAPAVAEFVAGVERRGAEKFHKSAMGLIGYVIASRTTNQPDYMIGLADAINYFCSVIGDEDRVEFHGDGFRIVRKARAAELEGK